jgi:hypothetical protein
MTIAISQPMPHSAHVVSPRPKKASNKKQTLGRWVAGCGSAPPPGNRVGARPAGAQWGNSLGEAARCRSWLVQPCRSLRGVSWGSSPVVVARRHTRPELWSSPRGKGAFSPSRCRRLRCLPCWALGAHALMDFSRPGSEEQRGGAQLCEPAHVWMVVLVLV